MQVRGPARRARAGTICASTSSTRRPAPTFTGRGWSTCRSPALKLLLHALLRRPRSRSRSRWRSRRLLPMLVAMAALAVTVRRLIDAARPSPSRSPCSPAPARRAACGAAAHRSSWLAAGHARLGGGRADRSEARARRRHCSASRPRCRWRSAWRCCSISPLAGAVTVLALDQRPRARRGGSLTYGASLGGGCALAFLRLHLLGQPRAGLRRAVAGLAVGDGRRRRDRGRARLADPVRAGRRGSALAALAGAALAAAFALVWPALPRPARADRSPELERLWLSKVREAMPIWRHGASTAALIVTLPIAGLIGYALMLWRSRRDPRPARPLAAIAAARPLLAAPAAAAGRPAPARPRSCCRSPARPPWPGRRSSGCWARKRMLVRVAGVVVRLPGRLRPRHRLRHPALPASR